MRLNCRRSGLVTVVALLLVGSFTQAADDTTFTYHLVYTEPGLSLHKEMFMLPATYSDKYNEMQTEAVFQMSAKHRIFNTRFYFAYTQISFWQAYDHDNSAPFRETNYNPEIFYRFKTSSYGSGRYGADVGIEHESNGQRVPASRSWNLLYFSPHYYTSDFLIKLKLRYRIPEDEKESPDSPEGDDNPDITDYLGYTDASLYYRFWDTHLLHLKLRGFIGHGRGNATITYSFPIPRTHLSYLCVRLFHGYGESLVDYNEKLTRFGVGVMFTR